MYMYIHTERERERERERDRERTGKICTGNDAGVSMCIHICIYK